MLLADSLVVIGLAVASLGTIHEAEGEQQHTFWLRNAGSRAVTLVQGYTSCGCTTIQFDRDSTLAPGDSLAVGLRFNPRGKGGPFWESGTVVYGPAEADRATAPRRRLQLVLEGNCVTSEETLHRQFPVVLAPGLRLSADRFDLGRMRHGEQKTRSVVVLHADEDNRQEPIQFSFTADASLTPGIHHIQHTCTVHHQGKPFSFTVTLDVLIL